MPDANAAYREATTDLERYWGRRAKGLEWYQPWDKVLDESSKPFYKWFVGGKTNIVLNAIDRHVKTWRRNKIALIWEGENGEVRTFSYHALNREICKFAIVLRSMGIQKGDRVTIYMPRIPETWVAMLGCAKVGAVHSVVYGGFSVEALHGRIEDSGSKLIITADGGYMGGKIVELKNIVDEALTRTAAPENVIVVKRTGKPVSMEAGRLAPKAALQFGLTAAFGGVAYLSVFTNSLAGFLAAVTLITYVLLYTPLKRVTPFATVIGGVPGALPPVIGWSAVTGELSMGAWSLFFILFFWQMPHFLALAWMYRKDYARARFQMLCVADPSGEVVGRQSLVYCIVLLAAALMPTMVGVLGTTYFAGALVLSAGFVVLGVRFYRNRTNGNARKLFFASLLYLSLLIALMILDRMI